MSLHIADQISHKKMSWAHGMNNLKSLFIWNIFRNSFPNNSPPIIFPWNWDLAKV